MKEKERKGFWVSDCSCSFAWRGLCIYGYRWKLVPRIQVSGCWYLWDKGTLIGKAKKNKELINCFPWAGRFSSLRKLSFITCNSDLGREMPSLQTSSSFFFLQLYIVLSMMLNGLEYPLGQFGVSCPGCVSSQLPMHSAPSHQRCSRRSRRGLGAVQVLLSKSNISVLSILLPGQNTQPHPGYSEEK